MKRSKTENKSFIIFSLFWPFAAFMNAIRHYSTRQSRIVVYIFVVFFGFTFVLGNELMDSFSYALKFKYTATLPFNQFYNVISGLYDSETSLDIMMPLVNFVFSRFTDDHRMLFGIWAIIFGYFFLKSVNLQHDKYVQSKNINLLFFIFLFVILNPITNINGFRFWTATWIFFFGAYKTIVNKDKTYLWLSFFSIFFHFSFIAPNVVLLSYLVLGNRNILYVPLLIVSFVIAELSLQFAPQIAGYLGEGFSDKASRYTADITLEGIQYTNEANKARGAWYLFLPGKVLTLYIYMTVLYVYSQRKKNAASKVQKDIFSFLLLFLSFVNFISSIPSMGRFRTVFNLFALVYIINYFAQQRSRSYHWLVYLGLIPLILNLIFTVRMAMDVFNPWLFAPNPLAFIFSETSFYELLMRK